MAAVRAAALAVICVVIGTTAPGAAPVRQRTTPPNPLTTATALKCTFSASAVRRGSDGEVEPGNSPPVTLTVTDIVLADGTAQVDSGGAPHPATVQLTGSNLYLLDIGPAGSTLTTVFSQENRNKRLKAVHTRTEPDVAHFAGECEVLK